jgi:putative aldouronate transport system substrate-binding protein
LSTSAWGGNSYKDVKFIKPPASHYGAIIKQNDPPGELRLNTYTITKACKHPELLLLFQEYCNMTPDNRFLSLFGPEGGAWKYNGSHKIVNTTDFVGKPYSSVAQARATLGPGYRLATIITAADEGRREYTGSSLDYQVAIRTIYGPPGGVAYKHGFPVGNDNMQNSTARTEAYTEINNYIENFVSRSVMNGINQSQWNAHLQNCKKLNVMNYLAGFQSLYNRLKKK